MLARLFRLALLFALLIAGGAHARDFLDWRSNGIDNIPVAELPREARETLAPTPTAATASPSRTAKAACPTQPAAITGNSP